MRHRAKAALLWKGGSTKGDALNERCSIIYTAFGPRLAHAYGHEIMVFCHCAVERLANDKHPSVRFERATLYLL